MKKIFLLLLLLTSILFANVAKVVGLKGEANIIRDGKIIIVEKNTRLKISDILITKNNSKIQIIFKDETIVSIGKNSKFKINDYVFEDKNNAKADFSMFKGVFRTITGKIGKIAPQNFKLKTKTASIGIRGTQIVTQISDDYEKIFCTEGQIEVTQILTNSKIIINAGEFIKLNDNSIDLIKTKTKASDLASITKSISSEENIISDDEEKEESSLENTTSETLSTSKSDLTEKNTQDRAEETTQENADSDASIKQEEEEKEEKAQAEAAAKILAEEAAVTAAAKLKEEEAAATAAKLEEEEAAALLVQKAAALAKEKEAAAAAAAKLEEEKAAAAAAKLEEEAAIALALAQEKEAQAIADAAILAQEEEAKQLALKEKNAELEAAQQLALELDTEEAKLAALKLEAEAVEAEKDLAEATAAALALKIEQEEEQAQRDAELAEIEAAALLAAEELAKAEEEATAKAAALVLAQEEEEAAILAAEEAALTAAAAKAEADQLALEAQEEASRIENLSIETQSSYFEDNTSKASYIGNFNATEYNSKRQYIQYKNSDDDDDDDNKKREVPSETTISMDIDFGSQSNQIVNGKISIPNASILTFKGTIDAKAKVKLKADGDTSGKGDLVFYGDSAEIAIGSVDLKNDDVKIKADFEASKYLKDDEYYDSLHLENLTENDYFKDNDSTATYTGDFNSTGYDKKSQYNKVSSFKSEISEATTISMDIDFGAKKDQISNGYINIPSQTDLTFDGTFKNNKITLAGTDDTSGKGSANFYGDNADLINGTVNFKTSENAIKGDFEASKE